jgi:tetratricopeptide (TPR) repeat protein
MLQARVGGLGCIEGLARTRHCAKDLPPDTHGGRITMNNQSLRRLAMGTALVVAGVLLSDALFDLVPPKAGRAQAAELLNPHTLALSRCAGGGGALMQALGSMGMARIGSLFHGSKPKTEVPLWSGLGNLSYKVSTHKKLAQAYFDQGLRLSYAFNHAEAIRSFRQAQAIDPKCAMCFWGESLAYGPNINLDMQAEAVAPAYAALTKAQALARHANAKEQALIGALGKRYAEHPDKDRGALNKAYAEAMAGVAQTHPDDPDVLALYAEAMMDIRPWDYWQPGGTEPYPEVADLRPTLERAMTLSPNHVGALHLYIHTMEATPNVKLAEAAADRLEPLMPAAGHLVHMPGHIYMRVGREADSVKVNLAAVKADEAFIQARGGNVGFYGLAYYPHNVHFVMISAQLGGDVETVHAMAKKLYALVPDQILKQVVIAQPVKTSPLLNLAQMGDEASVMATPKPADDLPYVLHMWHYARALVMVRKGDVKGASAELAEMQKISASKALLGFPQTYLPAAALGAIAQEVILARIAQAKGKMKDAIAHLTKAADLQAALPYTEPPFWYYPVKQSLGGLLLASGKAKQASDVFRASLMDQPGNAWALYGLMKSYDKMGDKAAAAETKANFDKAWLGKPAAEIDLNWL